LQNEHNLGACTGELKVGAVLGAQNRCNQQFTLYLIYLEIFKIRVTQIFTVLLKDYLDSSSACFEAASAAALSSAASVSLAA